MTLPLDALPEHILFQTLNKMKTRSLCRMRQTCTYVYDFIEEKEEDFSPESGLAIDLEFSVGMVEEFNPEFLIGSFFYDGERKDMVLTSDNKYMFDDMATKALRIVVSTLITAQMYKRIQRRLRRLKPGCSNLILHRFPSATLYKFLDIVECSGNIDITQFFYCQQPDVYIWHLIQRPNHSQISLTIRDISDCQMEGLFDRVKKLREFFALCYSAALFERFLTDIQEKEDLGCIRRMKCVMKEELPPNLFTNKPFTHFSFKHLCVNTGRMAPRKIRKMQLFNKFCLIVETRFVWYPEIHIVLVDGRQEALLKALKEELRFDEMDEALEKEFPTASDKRKAENMKLTVSAYSKAIKR